MTGKTKKSRPVAKCARWMTAVLIGCLLFFHSPSTPAGPVIGPEYDVKLGFIWNFANFVTWPSTVFNDNPDVLVFCFASEDPSASVFYKLDGKKVHGKTIKVIAYKDGSCIEQSNILFFATQNKVLIQQALDLAKGRSILTIGEVDGFTRMGGIINFFKERNRLRFEVNIDAARREGLKMSAQLLGSAQIVKEETP